MTKIEVKEISINEIDQAAITLFYAFKNDPLMQWIFGDKKSYDEKSILLFKTWTKYCVLYGKAFRTNNFEAVALRKKPGKIKLTFWRMFRSGMLKTPQILGKESFKRLMEFDKIATQEEKKHVGEGSFWYCWMMGTNPEHQKKGFGSTLMQHTFDIARQDKSPCYLETASETSKHIHINNGFRVLSEIQLLESDVKVISMIKEFK